MSKIIAGAPYRLELDTGISLSAATQTRILYKAPDGAEGYFTASVSGTKVYADITGAQNNQAGLWKFHSSVLFTGLDAPYLGEAFDLKIYGKFI